MTETAASAPAAPRFVVQRWGRTSVSFTSLACLLVVGFAFVPVLFGLDVTQNATKIATSSRYGSS